MTVVALIGIIASLAVMSIKRSRSSDDADKWANLIRNTINMVRRRAISTGSTYMIDLRAAPTNRLQWCQVTDTLGSCTTATTTCPNSGSGMENGVVLQSGTDAQTVSYYKGADLALPNGTSTPTYAAATQIAMPGTGGVQIVTLVRTARSTWTIRTSSARTRCRLRSAPPSTSSRTTRPPPPKTPRSAEKSSSMD